MPTIQDQLDWEAQMIERGVDRYRAQQDAAVRAGRAHETSAGSALMRAYVLQISDHLRLYLAGKHPDGRRRNKYAALLNTIDPDKTALFALTRVIASLYEPVSIQSIATDIGKAVESEVRFSKFEVEYKEYYDELRRSWERSGTTDYGHKQRALAVKSRDKGMQWDRWPNDECFGVGSLVLSLLLEVCDVAEVVRTKRKNGRVDARLVPTEQCLEYVMQVNELQEAARPVLMPCIVPPADWTSLYSGGYYSPRIADRAPLVKRHYRSKRLGPDVNMPDVLRAVNAIQGTAWSVNTRVLEVMRTVWDNSLQIGMPRSEPYQIPNCPLPDDVAAKSFAEGSPEQVAFNAWKAEARELHTLEAERIAQGLAVSRTIRMAAEMQQYDKFWYVYQCDFRGRVYAATPGLSPQGTDQSKGLIRFAEGKPLGETGWYWFRVHGANKYGNDKCSYDDRVAWVDERRDHWMRAAADPLSHRDVWKDADNPWQFLAWLFEYADAVNNPQTFVSHIPVSLDGSCNGLQHFSAMLRDSVGGAAVNLVDADTPSDIYQQVGDVATRKLKGLRALNTPESGGATNWLAMFKHVWGEERMLRKLPKKPVMTLPYGSTQQACTSAMLGWIVENDQKFFDKNTNFRHALYLSPIVWSSISEVVIAARQAMDWLQSCATVMTRAGVCPRYTTPLGFPIVQSEYKIETRKIETQIGGRLQLRMATDTDTLDSNRQRNGISPNFVHGVDATHLLMCVNAGADAGITSFATIHDDFGVHACDTAMWHRIIRSTFVRLHSTNLLEDFKNQQEALYGISLPDLPPTGTLHLPDVLSSRYFFG